MPVLLPAPPGVKVLYLRLNQSGTDAPTFDTEDPVYLNTTTFALEGVYGTPGYYFLRLDRSATGDENAVWQSAAVVCGNTRSESVDVSYDVYAAPGQSEIEICTKEGGSNADGFLSDHLIAVWFFGLPDSVNAA